MGAAAVSADVWDEFFCSAYCTAFQDCLVLGEPCSLKIVPAKELVVVTKASKSG